MEKISQEFIDLFSNESDDFEVFQKEFYEKITFNRSTRQLMA